MSVATELEDADGVAALACTTCPVEGCRVRPYLDELTGCVPESLLDISRHTRGKLLLKGQDSARDLWIIVSGMTLVQHVLPDGRRQILDFRFPGEILCPGALGSNSELSVQTVCTTKICHISSDTVSRLVTQQPRLIQELFEIACGQIKRAHLQMIALGRLTAPERIATFLLEMAARTRQPVCDRVEFLLPMNREDIADFLGLNSETVSRLLSRLRKGGVIEMPKPGHAIIRDVDALTEMTPFPDGIRRALDPTDAHTDIADRPPRLCPVAHDAATVQP